MKDFDFVIADNIEPLCSNDNKTWYVAPITIYELRYLICTFKENIDFILIAQWDGVENDQYAGYDILISDKIYNWFILKYGPPDLDIYSDSETILENAKDKLKNYDKLSIK